MTYQVFNSETVLDYLRSRDSYGNMFPKGAKLQAKEVGDGNLNLVFIVTNREKPDQGVVVKQAVPYLRVAGESWPLTLERMKFETAALLLYNKLTPELAPEVFDHDEENSLVVMEYLGKHEIMRKPLVNRVKFPLFVDHISTFLARTLFYTSDPYLTGLEKKEMQKQFINPHLCKIQEDFVFTNPYMESPENHWNPLIDDEVQAVRRNGRLKVRMAEMKEAYMTHGQALIHSDLHTGSIMLNQTETKIIDPEFAFFGPIGYDVGAVLQNLVLNYLSHIGHTPDKKARVAYQEYLMQMIRDIWYGFVQKFDTLWKAENKGELVPTKYWEFPYGEEAFAEFRRRYIQNIFRDVVGIGGCKMLRRMMGIVTVWDISSIADAQVRSVAERLAVHIGVRWVMEKESIHTIEDMMGIVDELAKGVNA